MCRDNVSECREVFTDILKYSPVRLSTLLYFTINKIIIINQFVCSTILLLQSMMYIVWDNALFTALTTW